MAKVLLLVKYGSNASAEISEFKNELKKRGWKKGVLDGVFQKRFLEMPPEIEKTARKDVGDAASIADFGRTCCEVAVISEEINFCWEWD